MKFKNIIIVITFFISLNSQANTNISHAIAMHGKPKYDQDFLNVEYIDIDALKGGSIVRSAVGTFDSFNPFMNIIPILLCFQRFLDFYHFQKLLSSP